MSLKKRVLGRTGIEVTELCLGTLILGKLQANLEPLVGARAVRRALELGVTFIDTAKGYKTYDHIRIGTEECKDYVIASKSPAKTAQEMRTDVESCLAELKRETIDIFHLHGVRNAEDMREREEALDALVKCREEGLIRSIGLSSHGVAGTRCALDYDEIEVVFPIINMKGLGITEGTHEEILKLIREIHASGRGLYVMKPLGGGHLIHDIPAAIEYVRKLGFFDSISVGLKTPEEVEVMVGVFEQDPVAVQRALTMGKERANMKRLIIYDLICQRCGICVDECAQGAMKVNEKSAEVNPELCILCGYCAAACPKFAIRVI